MPDRGTPILSSLIPTSPIPANQTPAIAAAALQTAAIDCLFQTIFGFMLPFFLAGAGGNAELGCAAIMQLIDAYNAATAAELDLVGRVIGFSTAAMDNLKLSMQPNLSDTKVLQYRNSAIALNRIADSCRNTLETMQAKREQAENQPLGECRALAPTTLSAPTPQPVPCPAVSAKLTAPAHPAPPLSAVDNEPEFAFDLATMQRNAHAMLADLQARAQQLGPDAPEASIAEAVRTLGAEPPLNRHPAA